VVVGFSRRRTYTLIIGAGSCLAASIAANAQPTPLPLVPSQLSAKLHDSLTLVRTNLDARLNAYRSRKSAYDARCTRIPATDRATIEACAAEFAATLPEATALGKDKAAFVSGIARLESIAIHTDTKVVDARVPREGADLIAQVPELAQSPEADRIMKGYQGVIHHDWPIALVWWKEALQRDPNNKALQRSVELAQWMVDRKKPDGVLTPPQPKKGKVAEPIPPLSAAIYAAARGDNVSAIRHFEEAKARYPRVSGLDDMINLLQRKEDALNVWSKAEIQSHDARVQSVVDGFLREAAKSQAAGKYQDAQGMYMAADMAKMQLSTESPSRSTPHVVRLKK